MFVEPAGVDSSAHQTGRCVDNVDVAAATERGILVVNAPTANLISATEHTFGLLLALARNIPAAAASVRAGEWERKRFQGHGIISRQILDKGPILLFVHSARRRRNSRRF